MNLGFGNIQEENDPPFRNTNDSLYDELMECSGLLTIGGVVRRVSVEDLEFVAELGHGSCGHVTKRQYNGIVMAVKSMPRSSNPIESKRIIMDLRILSRSYDCTFIVHSYGYLVTENEVMICMEAMATCLDLLLKQTKNAPIPEPIVGKMSVSVVKALHYLKKNHNVIHRDVKPSNILLDWSGVVKLCDFGISGFLIESRAKSKLAGCPPYMAPERVCSTENTHYDIRSDVWSLGITMVELATGHFPYEGSDFQIISSILELPSPSLKTSDGFSEDFCNLVDLCLRRNVEERPRYDFILEHPFIVNNERADTDVSEWFSDIMSCMR
ncbi:kinase domain protein [Dictyocaulus viviparus]|uniref:mitogen-activated protein kinase kinase n=1 Tax=Dictyocaulus viviparus TaxID=29172 RepID=A0A0D8XCD7_DICVI|nr:kinase domain protein [Dictyocaulus viviparus]